MKYTIRLADLNSPKDSADVLALLDAYAADPMGDGRPLSASVKERFIREFSAFPTSVAFLAFDHAQTPIGLATCFFGFSTFAARPLLNVSDFFVLPQQRGSGIGRLLLQAIEQYALEKSCCRLSLEVQEKNARARHLYQSAGFGQAVYSPEAGGSLYYVKPLANSPHG